MTAADQDVLEDWWRQARASGGDIVDIRELTDRVVEQIRRENAATRAGRGGR